MFCIMTKNPIIFKQFKIEINIEIYISTLKTYLYFFYCVLNSIYFASCRYGLSRWLGRTKWPRGSRNTFNLYSSYVYLCIVCKNDSFVHTRQKHRLFSLYAYFWPTCCPASAIWISYDKQMCEVSDHILQLHMVYNTWCCYIN